MGNEFVIDDGSKEYVFKNHFGEEFARFSFNPSDTGIVHRYDDIVRYFESTNFSSESEEETVEKIKELDSQIKEQFNLLCGKNVSDGLFKQYAPLTLFANGEFYCEIALDKITSFIESEMNVRLEKKKAKIRKDIAKNKA